MNIYQKLVEVRKSVDYLQKVSQGHGFKYTGSSQVLSSVRQKMNEVGLLLIPSIATAECRDHTTGGGKTWKFTELTMTMTWVNAEKPEESIMCMWYGQGMDDMEKGVGKALTYAEKYFMLKFFNIPTDLDDPDAFIPKEEKAKYVATEPARVEETKPEPVAAPAPRKMSDPATAGQIRFVESLSKKHGFDVPAGLTKSQAASLIKKYGG